MPLRNPNNPNTDAVLLAAFKIVLLGYPAANTLFGINNYSVFIQDEGAIFTGGVGTFPAMLLSVGAQDYMRASRSTWMGEIELIAEVYDAWQQQSNTFSSMWSNLSLDLERMKANIESNESLAQNNTAYAVSAYRHVLSPYAGDIVEKGGIRAITRKYSVHFHLLPYDS